MPTRTYDLTFPLIGKVTIAKWDFQCSPPVSMVKVPLIVAAGVDVELNLEKIKEAIGELGSLIPDKRLQKFMKTAKKLAPEGKVGLKVALSPTNTAAWCPGYEQKKASYLSFSLQLNIIATIAGSYGIVKGKSYAILAFELASDSIFCECPEAPSREVSLNDFGAIGSCPELLLADGPEIPTPLLFESACEPNKYIEQTKSSDTDETIDDTSENKQEAILTITDEYGEQRVLEKFPIY